MGTPSGVPPEQGLLALSSQLCFALYSTSRAMTAYYRPFLERMGITYPQYLVLLALWEQPGLTMKELGENLRLDYGTLSPLTKRLEAAGLIERTRGADDGRTLVLTPTAASKPLQSQAVDMIETALTEVGYPLDAVHDLRDHITEFTRRLDAVDQS